MAVRSDQPLIGIMMHEDDREVVRYFAEEADADAAAPASGIQRALRLAGSWSDLEWNEFEAALDRVRYESRPTPPIEL